MRIIIVLAAAALAWAAPARATPTLNQIEQAQPVPGADPSEYAEALRGYGEWVVRVSQIHAPLQATLNGLSGEWETVRSSRRPEALAEFRASVARAVSQLDAVHAELSALPNPDVSVIAFPSGLRPEAMGAEMLRLNRQLRAAVESFLPAIDAVGRGDAAAADAAVRRMMEGLGLVLESNVVVSRAMLSIVPRAGAEWEIANIEHLFFRAAARTFRSWPHLLAGTSDASLVPELLQIADELETNAAAGDRKNEDDLAGLSIELSVAPGEVDPNVVAVQRQARGAMEAARGIFAVARRLARQIREGARRLNGDAGGFEAFANLFTHFREFRRDYDAAVLAMGAAMAAR
ncbi:MAG: hypothetical protein M3177_01105 [Pseudomonadota bacterium]|nr:hypothetical protein [Pseudomonadota bacterium]